MKTLLWLGPGPHSTGLKGPHCPKHDERAHTLQACPEQVWVARDLPLSIVRGGWGHASSQALKYLLRKFLQNAELQVSGLPC